MERSKKMVQMKQYYTDCDFIVILDSDFGDW